MRILSAERTVMKTPTTRNCNKTVMRCLIGFAALVLFVPQLSYKFYLCANNPTWTCKYRISKGAPPPPASTPVISFSHQHCRPLSIDKRYDLKLLFSLPAAPAVCPRPVALSVASTGHSAALIALRWPAARPLRGPPSIIPDIITLS